MFGAATIPQNKHEQEIMKHQEENAPSVSCFTDASGRMEALVARQLSSCLRGCSPRRIVIKPNWVIHETNPKFPIQALVTDPCVIAAVTRACATLFPTADRITVGDCPLQLADWPLMCRQSGLALLKEQLEHEFPGRVQFRDLRKYAFTLDKDLRQVPSNSDHGDPAGYREVMLHAQSHLEPISDQAELFSLHDHDPSVARNNHRPGDHRYFVCQTILDADLIINVPKWKTHSKSGLTAALKNLVGINGDKAYLPHFRRGAPRWGGDEYWDRERWLYWIQNSLRNLTRGRHPVAYDVLKQVWKAMKLLNTHARRILRRDAVSPDFYVGGGSWYGNQTIWRMMYDLNMIVQLADVEGIIRDQPQRRYFCVVDGLICGEGDGPLYPNPRPVDWLIFGDDPFAIDMVLAWVMGFDPEKIPVLARRREYLGSSWGDFGLDNLLLIFDGQTKRLVDVPTNLHFRPAPGWAGHIERRAVLALH